MRNESVALVGVGLSIVILTIIVTFVKMQTLKLVRIRVGDGSSIWNAPRAFGWTLPVLQVVFLILAVRRSWFDIGSPDDPVGRTTFALWTNVFVALLFLSQLLLLRGSRSE